VQECAVDIHTYCLCLQWRLQADELPQQSVYALLLLVDKSWDTNSSGQGFHSFAHFHDAKALYKKLQLHRYNSVRQCHYYCIRTATVGRYPNPQLRSIMFGIIWYVEL